MDELTLRFRTVLFLYEVFAKLAHSERNLQSLIIYLEVVGAQYGNAGLHWVRVRHEEGLRLVVVLSYHQGLDLTILTKEFFFLQQCRAQKFLGHSLYAYHVFLYYSEVI